MPIMNSMKYLAAFVRLVSLFALLGMLIAPVSTVAAEYAMADMVSSPEMQMDEMAEMQGDMPCCPGEQPVKSDCDSSCPFVIICSTTAPLAMTKAEWSAAALAWAPLVYDPQRSDRLISFAAEPPARPPKA
ncbi:MAG: hypothetical protein JWL86_6958 [Rhizobium sp.]|nr:hypothetical protein [Rhizobium sp.]